MHVVLHHVYHTVTLDGIQCNDNNYIFFLREDEFQEYFEGMFM